MQRLTANQILREQGAMQQRSMDWPEKVFIEREGPYWEYSQEAPGGIDFKIQNLLTGYYGCQNYIELFYSLPEVFAPVHEIAKRVSDANWQLRKSWNDEIDYNDADFNRLFTNPNPISTFKDFVYQSVCYEILTGKLMWYFNKPKTLPDEYKSIITWSTLPSDKVTIKMKTNFDPYTSTSLNDFIEMYKVAAGTGTRDFKEVEKVLPILNLSLSGTTYDLNNVKSYLQGADKAIRNLIPVYEARGIIYIKRGAMGVWVSRKSDQSGMIALTPAEMKEAAKQLNSDYGLNRNKETIGITSAPIDFVKSSMSIAELQPFEETLADATAIYTCLRVPAHFIPSKDKSTFNNANTDVKSFYEDVIIPWAKRYADIWTDYMKLGDFRRYIKPDFSHIGALQENRKEKADFESVNGNTYLQRWSAGVWSLNDWIVAIGEKKMTGPLYEKKILEYTPEELIQAKEIINLKSVPKTLTNEPGTKN